METKISVVVVAVVAAGAAAAVVVVVVDDVADHLDQNEIVVLAAVIPN